jgi:predicted nucleotidyltransferase
MKGMRVLEVDHSRLREICERYGIARLDIFGSASRDDLRPESDIDLLYTLVPGARLGWEIEDLSDELAVIFQRPVDLVAKSAVNRHIRDRVLDEARPFYAA